MGYKWSICIFLLLVFVENSCADARLRETVLNTLNKLRAPRTKSCENSDYKHDPALSSKLDGYFYNLYTSSAFADNEIIKYNPMEDNMIFARSATDGECCRTINFTLGEEYNMLNTETDADCSPQMSEDGQQKLIVANEEETDDSCCIIMWACHKSREGVHTVCNKRMVCQEQKEWIQKQYDMMGLKPLKIEQNVDYKGGKCFKN